MSGNYGASILDVEAMRAMTYGVRGVSFDARSRRFVADIFIDGRRVRIGSFLTLDEAAEAYEDRKAQTPRKATPSRSNGRESVTASYARFLADNSPLYEGFTVWTTPDGQEFTYLGEQFGNRMGKAWKFNRFGSNCRVCGSEFETLVLASPSAMPGVTRNCEEHRKAHSFGRSAQGPKLRAKEAAPLASRSEPREVRSEAQSLKAEPLDQWAHIKGLRWPSEAEIDAVVAMSIKNKTASDPVALRATLIRKNWAEPLGVDVDTARRMVAEYAEHLALQNGGKALSVEDLV